MDQKCEESIQEGQCWQLQHYMMLNPNCHRLLILPFPTAFVENEWFWDYIDLGIITGYKVSLSGRVINRKLQFMNNKPNKSGYIKVHLTFNTINKNVSVHIMIGNTFLYNDDPQNKKEIDHKIGNKGDNRVCALRWATHSENVLNRPPQKNSISVIEINQNGDIINTWPTIAAASKATQISSVTIKNQMKYLQTSSNGRIFRFQNITSNEIIDDEFRSYRPNKRVKAIIQMDINKNNLKIWRCAADAAISYSNKNVHNIILIKGNIRTSAEKNNKIFLGFKWRYASEQEIEKYLPRVPPDSLKHGKWIELKSNIENILVSSLGFIITRVGLSLGSKDANGYCNASFNGITSGINRLVLMAFFPIDNPQDYEADHINGNREENTIFNLRWLTKRQNTVAALGKAVIQYDLYGGIIAEYDSIALLIRTLNIQRRTFPILIGSYKTYNDHFFGFMNEDNMYTKNDLPVIQYDFCGGFFRRFNNIIEVLDKYNLEYEVIRSIIDKNLTYEDHYFRFEI